MGFLSKIQRHSFSYLFDEASKDAFFAPVVDDLVRYGYDIRRSFKDGLGAYAPYALEIEQLQTAERYEQFLSEFKRKHDAGDVVARLRFFFWNGRAVNAHIFLHELMHFYQDMFGLYFSPLKEEGVFPVKLDARSTIMLILFNEAWAETQALRSSWALKEQGFDLCWEGALRSCDWKDLAQSYADDLISGMSEQEAAARLFLRWYEGDHREAYEKHALFVFYKNEERFRADLQDKDYLSFYRCLHLSALLSRLPEDETHQFLQFIDINDTHIFYPQIDLNDFVRSDNTDINDIRIGAPPYLFRQAKSGEC